MPPESNMPPVALLIIDSGEIELIKKWSKEGHLPTISSIINSGCLLSVRGADLVNEMGSWISLFSGIAKDKHGYYGIRQLLPGTYQLEPAKPNIAGHAPPFWYHMRDPRKKVLVLDAPELDVFPDTPGVQLANWAAHESERLWESPRSVPPEALQDILKKFGKSDQFKTFDQNSTADSDYADWQLALARVKKKGEICRDLLARDKFALIVAAFMEAHTLGHRLWSYQSGLCEPNRLSFALRDLYSAIDHEFGLILSRLKEKSNIFIISAYGMEGMFPTSGLVNQFLSGLGYHAPLTTDKMLETDSVDPLTLLRQAIPKSWRKRISNFLPPQLQERLIASDFAMRTNWPETLAFAIPSLFNWQIRLNVKNREPLGLVEPGKEYDDLLDRIENDLNRLIDPKTGRRAVRRVVRSVSAFNCEIDHALPDVFVEWEPAPHFMDVLVHPEITLVQEPDHYHRSSFHSSTGFVAAAGPSIACTSSTKEINVRDLAPTFMSLLELPLPDYMQGKPIEALCSNPLILT